MRKTYYMKKNLIYYVCPFNSNDEWKMNVDILKKFISKFTGVKIITIASGEGLVDFDFVKQYFQDNTIHFMRYNNVKEFGETPPFIMMCEYLKNKSPDGITFYAHSKGVSPHYQSNDKKLKNKRIWRNILYYFNLKDMGIVEQQLQDNISSGCIKRNFGLGCGTNAKWFYAGNFFWFNTQKFFSNPEWNIIRMTRMGVESYWGEKYDSDMGGCIFGEDMPTNIINYDDKKWENYLSKYELTMDNFL